MPRDKDEKKPEVVENEPPLQEIVPDTEEERKRHEDAIKRQQILDDPDAPKKFKIKKKKEPNKVNRVRTLNGKDVFTETDYIN